MANSYEKLGPVKDSPVAVSVARVQSEMNRVWAMANPELFTKAVWDFADKYIEDGDISIEMNQTYITLIATERRDAA